MTTAIERTFEIERGSIDLETGRWTIPEARNKSKREHVVILSRQALAIAKARIEATEGDYLWPAGRGSGHFRVDSASGAIRKAQASLKVKPWTAHDLRRTLATGMGDLGVTGDVIGRVLNHSRRDVTGRVYDRATRDAQAKEAWQRATKCNPELTLSTYEERLHTTWRDNEEIIEPLMEGLRKLSFG